MLSISRASSLIGFALFQGVGSRWSSAGEIEVGQGSNVRLPERLDHDWHVSGWVNKTVRAVDPAQ